MLQTLPHDECRRVHLTRTLFRSFGAATLMTDRAGRVTCMNSEAERLTAWSEKEALGRQEEELFCIRDRKRGVTEDPVRRALEMGDVICLTDDAVLVARNGAERNICGSIWPLLDDKGDVRSAGIIFHDRTRAAWDLHWTAFLHEASLALSASLDYETTLGKVARLAVDSVADGCAVAMVQPDGSIRALAGAHADRAKKPLVDEIVRSARLDPSAEEGAPRAIREGKPVIYLDVHDGYVDPGHRYVLGTRDPGYSSAIRALGICSFICVPLIAGKSAIGSLLLGSGHPWRFESSDVERAQELANLATLAIENARLYREAREALAVREEFMNVAAHELRTPLTALKLSLESLERVERSRDPRVLANLARVVSQANRLHALSETMLEVMRFDAGRVPLHFGDVDLRQLVASAAETCREEASRARCTIALGSGPQVVVRCDKGRIEQVVCCLLSNGIKFGVGHPIEVTVDTTGGMGRIMVTDHGIGIAREHATRIFERFERAVSSQHYGGFGLGLYLAREVVHAHGGSIAVSSEPGVGSTFTVVLPR